MAALEPVLLFLAIFGLVMGLGGIWGRRRRSRPRGQMSIVRQPIFGNMTRPLAQVIPYSSKKRQQMARDLVSAGNYRATALEDFLAKRNLAVLATLLGVAALFALGLADGRELWVGAAGLVTVTVVFAVPGLVLTGAASRRTQQIEKAVPDALDMMALSIAGGIPLDHSVRTVAKQLSRTHRALARELEMIARQCESGSIDQAFASFAKRIDLPEVAAWCSLMQQGHRLGGRMVVALTDYANRIRLDRKNRAERSGNTASIKLLLPVVLCLTPPIAVMLIGPAILDFRDFINREKGTTTQVQRAQNLGNTP
ncbi:MAG: type II secretion system F family protein [Planctomycetales bacterium]|nr:type II secretion system F family protein [Planctomycetales bacterium]